MHFMAFDLTSMGENELIMIMIIITISVNAKLSPNSVNASIKMGKSVIGYLSR